jgi:hypothetical protein
MSIILITQSKPSRPGRKDLGRFLVASVVLAVLIIAAAGVLLKWLSGAGTASSQSKCERMIRVLETTTSSHALLAEARALVSAHPSGAAHRLAPDEQPREVKAVMQALGLSEAIVADDVISRNRILCLAAPGGFTSYGVKVRVQSWTATKNLPRGLTELEWKEGICVFYLH